MANYKENYLKKELYNLIKRDNVFFDFIQEGSLDGLWYWNLEKLEDEWMSPKFWEVLGFDPNEKKHNPSEWQDIIFKEDLEKATVNFEKHCKNPKHPYDQTVRYRHKNGSIVWIRCRGIAVRDENGKAIRMLGAHTDITDIKQKEQFLKDSEQRQKSIVQSLGAGIVIHASDGSIIDTNNQAQEILGFSEDQLLGKKVTDPAWIFINEDEASLPVNKYPVNVIMENKKIIKDLIIGIVHYVNKKIIWTKVNGVPIFDSKGRLSEVVISFIDVTNFIDSQRKIANSESRLRKLFEQASYGYQSLDDKGCFLEVNDRWLEIMGYTKEEVIGKWFGDFLLPDMREKFTERFELFKKKGSVHSEFSMRTKDGNIIQVVFDGKIAYDENNSIIQTHCTVADITEINIATEKLQQSEEKYRLLTSEMQLGLALHETICDDDEHPINFRFLDVNKSWEKLMGVKKEDILGKTVLEVFPNTELLWIEAFGKVALTGKSIKFENYSTELNKYLSASVYSPKKGQFAVVVDDITEKKKQEDLIDYSSKHDPLTDIPNRYYYDEILLELDKNVNFPLGIVMMDINGLKLINDSFGQTSGDEVLKQFVAILRKEKRKEDFIARTSGDEFAMLCPRTSTKDIMQFKQRLLNKVSKQRINSIEYSVAFGYSIKDTKKQNIFDVVKEAENAMYKNKIVYGQGTRSEAIESIFSTFTNKYSYEKNHSERVAIYSRLIGKYLDLREDELDELELSGRLHDIGKIAISDDIIMKPGKLNDEEWKKIKEHTVIGYQILRAADKYSNLAEFAMSHHERMDGKGYPNGIKGKDIPLFARIICVADAYEAMTSDRTYRKTLKKEIAIQELKDHAGTQFDPKIVDVFINKVLLNE